jgi:PmbA protein
MSAELKERAAQAVELAQKAGAQDAWSTASQSRDVQFEYRDGNLEKVKDTTSQNLGIRIYAGGRYSSHSTTDLSPNRLQDFITGCRISSPRLLPLRVRSSRTNIGA